MTEAQTADERPRSRAKRLIKGNIAAIGTKESRLVIKSFFNPRRRTIFAKNSTCIVALNGPKIPRHSPIDAGDMPSPPRWTGVAKKRG